MPAQVANPENVEMAPSENLGGAVSVRSESVTTAPAPTEDQTKIEVNGFG